MTAAGRDVPLSLVEYAGPSSGHIVRPREPGFEGLDAFEWALRELESSMALFVLRALCWVGFF